MLPRGTRTPWDDVVQARPTADPVSDQGDSSRGEKQAGHYYFLSMDYSSIYTLAPVSDPPNTESDLIGMKNLAVRRSLFFNQAALSIERRIYLSCCAKCQFE